MAQEHFNTHHSTVHDFTQYTFPIQGTILNTAHNFKTLHISRHITKFQHNAQFPIQYTVPLRALFKNIYYLFKRSFQIEYFIFTQIFIPNQKPFIFESNIFVSNQNTLFSNQTLYFKSKLFTFELNTLVKNPHFTF